MSTVLSKQIGNINHQLQTLEGQTLDPYGLKKLHIMNKKFHEINYFLSSVYMIKIKLFLFLFSFQLKV